MNAPWQSNLAGSWLHTIRTLARSLWRKLRIRLSAAVWRQALVTTSCLPVFLSAGCIRSQKDASSLLQNETNPKLTLSELRKDRKAVYLEYVRRSKEAGGSDGFLVPEWLPLLEEQLRAQREELANAAAGESLDAKANKSYDNLGGDGDSGAGVPSTLSTNYRGFRKENLEKKTQESQSFSERVESFRKERLTYRDFLLASRTHALILTQDSIKTLSGRVNQADLGYAEHFIDKYSKLASKSLPYHFVLPVSPKDNLTLEDFINARAVGVGFVEIPMTVSQSLVDGVLQNSAVFFGHDIFHHAMIVEADNGFVEYMRSIDSSDEPRRSQEVEREIQSRIVLVDRLKEIARSHKPNPGLAEEFLFYVLHEVTDRGTFPEGVRPSELTPEGIKGYLSQDRAEKHFFQFSKFQVVNHDLGPALQKKMFQPHVISFFERAQVRILDMDGPARVKQKKFADEWWSLWDHFSRGIKSL